jgi:hypothetical protein
VTKGSICHYRSDLDIFCTGLVVTTALLCHYRIDLVVTTGSTCHYRSDLVATTGPICHYRSDVAVTTGSICHYTEGIWTSGMTGNDNGIDLSLPKRSGQVVTNGLDLSLPKGSGQAVTTHWNWRPRPFFIMISHRVLFFFGA